MGLFGRGDFWQGGQKIGGRDVVAGLMAIIGDTLSRNSGGQGFATQGLMGGRLDALEMAKKAQAGKDRLAEMIAVGQANGLTPEQVRAQHLGLDLPKPDKPPAMGQNLDYFIENIQSNPERLKAFRQYNDIVNPWRVTGQDGVPYQMDNMPDFIPDDEMEGGTGNGVGGFPYRR